MADFLQRSQSPLTNQEWQALDRVVVKVARHNLIARRFLTLFGPVGAGLQSFAIDRFSGGQVGQISLLGAEERDVIAVRSRRFAPLPVLYCDFRLEWRDLETSRRLGTPLETTGPAIAASTVATMEDRLIFNGYDELQQEGFLNVEGRQRVPLGDWGTMGGGFAAVVNAVQALIERRFQPPFTLVVPPPLFVHLNRVYNNTGVLEIEQVRRLIGGDIYVTPALPSNVAVVVAPGPENMDLLIAQDLVTAYLETTAMEHHFRVLEILSLRVKRPEAVCTLGQV